MDDAEDPVGHPDLQGVWTTDWERSVPFQRPEDLGERPELTSEEIAARAADEARALADDKDERNTRAGDPEAGPEHWYEFGDHTSPRTSLIVQPANGRMPPKTLGGATRQIDPTSPLGFVGGSMGDGPWNGPEDLHLADRCITRGLPQTWIPSAYNNGFQIVQHPDHVAILYERLHEHRLIPLDDRPALHSGIRTWFGDSRGYWEGDTLVVEVTNFSDRTTFHGAGATRRLVERYHAREARTRSASRSRFTIPATWTEPWTLVAQRTPRPRLLADLRVRLPRGELRHDQHPQRRPQPGEARRGGEGRGEVAPRALPAQCAAPRRAAGIECSGASAADCWQG